MTEENKQTETVEETKPETQEVPRGDRGELGVATASLTIKQMWHEEHHVLMDIGDKHNPRKQMWQRKQGSPSLKRYARQLLASGNEVAKEWFAHKTGTLDQARSDKNVARISAEKSATKMAKRKKSQKGGKTEAPAAK